MQLSAILRGVIQVERLGLTECERLEIVEVQEREQGELKDGQRIGFDEASFVVVVCVV